VVEGIALPMSGDARGLVDHKEGAISGLYEPLAVSLRTADGEIAALAYRAARDRRLPSEEKPATKFVETLIRGGEAFGLSPAWISKLRAFL
jgi:hypothetical protein